MAQKMAAVHGTLCTVPLCNSNYSPVNVLNVCYPCHCQIYFVISVVSFIFSVREKSFHTICSV
jgi:hypothetical protein